MINFRVFSNEVKAKFKKIRPKTMGQALRIDGITPAAVYILLSHVPMPVILNLVNENFSKYKNIIFFMGSNGRKF